jgi:hypothetical protein
LSESEIRERSFSVQAAPGSLRLTRATRKTPGRFGSGAGSDDHDPTADIHICDRFVGSGCGLFDSGPKCRGEGDPVFVHRRQDRAGIAGAIPHDGKTNLVSARKITLNPGHGDIGNTVTSDDQITLRFRAKDFIGEFFHYTDDLFLIYHSGHLAKLTCTPGQ